MLSERSMFNVVYHSIFDKAVVGAKEFYFYHNLAADSYRNNYMVYRTLRQTLSAPLLFTIYRYVAYSGIFTDYVCIVRSSSRCTGWGHLSVTSA